MKQRNSNTNIVLSSYTAGDTWISSSLASPTASTTDVCIQYPDSTHIEITNIPTFKSKIKELIIEFNGDKGKILKEIEKEIDRILVDAV